MRITRSEWKRHCSHYLSVALIACKRDHEGKTLPPPYPQSRFSTIRMMDVDTKEHSKLGSDFMVEQCGGERSGPVVIGENNDMVGV